MPGASTVLKDRVLNWLRGTAFATAPVTGYVGLYTTATGPGAEGTEVTGGAYARVAVTSVTGWAAPATDVAKRYIVNTGTVTFPTATAAWGTATHWAYHDAATAGNRLLYGTLPTAKVIGINDVASFAAGNLRAEMP